MVQLKRNLLSVALASATMMLAAQAHAQSAPAADQDGQEAVAKKKDDAKNLDTVVVTGIRGGIERAIDTKKNATSIVEAVSAEDIGKLPDVSIAESIARLPGLAAQRVAGRAQVISVRGLSPDFATTLLNGRELVSTGDNRSVEFDQYPSELMAGVTVYKTPDASMVGQGLSGTLDMRTVRPLDYEKPVFAISGRMQRNSLGSAGNTDADGNRFNVSYIGQSSDRKVGFTIGYSHSDTPIQENQVGLYEPWEEIGGNDWRPGISAGTFYSNGIKALRRTGYTKRDGVMASLEFRPSDAWISTLDVFHSKATQEDTANQFEVNLGDYNGGFGRINITNAQINGNKTFIGGDVANVYPLVRGMYNKREDTIKAFGWKNEFFFGSTTIVADASWSKANRDELSLENNTQLAPVPSLDTLALTYSSNDFSQMVPGRDYSDPSKLFLRNTIYGSGYGKTPRVEDELMSLKLGANVPAPESMGWLSSIDFGLNYADRSKAKRQPEGNINVGAQGDTVIGSEFQYGLVDLGFAGIGYIPSWNVPGAVAKYMTFNPVENLNYLIPKAWTVDETILTGYLRANIDTEWGSVPVRGNIGLQIQQVDQSSASNYWDSSRPAGQEVQPINRGKKYTDVLPSMNLAFSLSDDQTLRVALARQVARPRVDQLRSSLEFGVDTSKPIPEPGAGGGNPELDPWRANALDISYEKYFGNKAYVAAAVFYKQLSSYIFTQPRDGYDFTELLAGYVLPPGVTTPPKTTGNYTAPYNGKGGKLQGLELTASLPFNLWSQALDGFGIVASASFTDSNIKIRDPESASSVGNADITLPGLSDQVYNLTAYYERNGFEARINNRRRSDFIGEIGDFAANRKSRYVVGEDITDAQIGYTFGEGRLKGLGLQLQISNLTNESYRTYAGDKDRPLEHIEWGRTVLLGASYKF